MISGQLSKRRLDVTLALPAIDGLSSRSCLRSKGQSIAPPTQLPFSHPPHSKSSASSQLHSNRSRHGACLTYTDGVSHATEGGSYAAVRPGVERRVAARVTNLWKFACKYTPLHSAKA
jgi:hypothetical protein